MPIQRLLTGVKVDNPLSFCRLKKRGCEVLQLNIHTKNFERETDENNLRK